MNLINTSEDKDHLFLKNSQRIVEVVLTLFYFIDTYFQEIKTKTYIQTNKQKTIMGQGGQGRQGIRAYARSEVGFRRRSFNRYG